MPFLSVLLLAPLLLVPEGFAQQTDRDRTAALPAGWVTSFGGSLAMTRGGFEKGVGALHPGIGLSLAMQGQHLAAGLDLTAYSLERRTETVQVRPSTDVDLRTITDMARIAFFGRYGWSMGARMYPHVEVLLGGNVFSTQTNLTNGSPGLVDGPELSFAPAAGGGVGIAVGIGALPVSLLIRVHHVFGGSADYFAYDDEEEAFVERSSNTTGSY